MISLSFAALAGKVARALLLFLAAAPSFLTPDSTTRADDGSGFVPIAVPFGSRKELCKECAVPEGVVVYPTQSDCEKGENGVVCKEGLWDSWTRDNVLTRLSSAGVCQNGWSVGITYDPSVRNDLLVKYVKAVYAYAKTIVATLASLMIVWGAVEWSTAGGNSSAISDGQTKIVGTFIGLGMFILAGQIIAWILPDIFKP